MNRFLLALITLTAVAAASVTADTTQAHAEPIGSQPASDELARRVAEAKVAMSQLQASRRAGTWSADAEAAHDRAKRVSARLQKASAKGKRAKIRRGLRALLVAIQKIGALLEEQEVQAAGLTPDDERTLLRTQVRRMQRHVKRLRGHADDRGVDIDSTRIESAAAEVREALSANARPRVIRGLLAKLRKEIAAAQSTMLDGIQSKEVTP